MEEKQMSDGEMVEHLKSLVKWISVQRNAAFDSLAHANVEIERLNNIINSANAEKKDA